ncbi:MULTISPECIES: ABC transporter ATP-binding protein [unclassified Bradyrhizobium]|uniref:ABC transporter ATP-binding protein n=1 Tax=unclassified Bradyrhizobium TaxID=2631580 RepID=UPI0024788197|nr:MULTISPECIES: ABC transporter ATP-binding protein [unclassified Bradyrhizobium]WGR73456.1 ABC transporter ATP-binding protein [Bradyrhizobium sp. ISRA426]WGR78293.1 ABC transporter ATP-binding protein [Bradyrhizobium sp. ISRA430]WGR88694.1 ABC transporter ATP-binding protein [Bradyrhizobium sp. ISRA432]
MLPAVSPVVLAERVTKWYGPRRAVADVSFTISPGEIVGLLGPNGSGKSTIFRMLTGYLVPTSGRIEVAGYDVVEDSLGVRRAISYVPEDAPLYDHMRVGEFLHFMAGLKGLHGPKARAAVDEATERLDLARVMKLTTGKLSRGFRQRVSIAQALLGDPRVLVLDEPTSGLDPHQVIAVRDLIQSLAGRHTVLLASHVLPEIEKIASRVMILLDGVLLTSDALKDAAQDLMLRLSVDAAEDVVRGATKAVAGVREIVANPDSAGRFLVRAERRPALAADLVSALVAAQIPVRELTELRPDLERVFLDLTRRPEAAA